MTWYEQDDAEPDDDVFARLNEDYDGRDDVERDAVRGGVGEGDDPSVEAAVPASDVPPSVGGAAARPDVSASPVASSAAYDDDSAEAFEGTLMDGLEDEPPYPERETATPPEQAIRRALDHLKVYCAGGEECRIHDEAEAALEALLTNRSKGC